MLLQALHCGEETPARTFVARETEGRVSLAAAAVAAAGVKARLLRRASVQGYYDPLQELWAAIGGVPLILETTGRNFAALRGRARLVLSFAVLRGRARLLQLWGLREA